MQHIKEQHRQELVANRAQQHALRKREDELTIVLATFEAIERDQREAAERAAAPATAPILP